MKTTYLLPCSCGRSIPVEPRQAGELVHCACGKAVQAPTWREIAALERSEAAEAPPPLRVGWGGPQRLFFSGALLVLVAAAAAVGVYQIRPEAPPDRDAPGFVQNEVEKLTPYGSVMIFHQIVDAGLNAPPKDPWQEAYQAARDRYLGWLALPALLGAAGVALLGLGGVLAAKSRGKIM